jgi:glycosyltransferase domain-containing protein
MKVAILIPTMNRLSFIERLVFYYNSLKSSHPIFIGDASDSGGSDQTRAILEKYTDVEVRYFHWESLDISRTMIKLAEEAAKEHQFCAYSGDDDYFVPSSLTQCAKFLSDNKGYRTAQGRAAIFTIGGPEVYGDIVGLGQYWGVNSLEQNTALERFKGFSENYFVAQFSIHRIDEFLDDSKLFKEIKDYSLGEMLHCFIFAIKGKSKFLDCLYMVRTDHDDRVSNPAGYVDWTMRPHWSYECNRVLEELSAILHGSSDLPLEDSRELVTGTLRADFYKSSIKLVLKDGKRGVILRSIDCLPTDLKKILRPLFFLTMDKKNMCFLQSKRSCFYEDFNAVVQIFEKNSTLGCELLGLEFP